MTKKQGPTNIRATRGREVKTGSDGHPAFINKSTGHQVNSGKLRNTMKDRNKQAREILKDR